MLWFNSSQTPDTDHQHYIPKYLVQSYRVQFNPKMASLELKTDHIVENVFTWKTHIDTQTFFIYMQSSKWSASCIPTIDYFALKEVVYPFNQCRYFVSFFTFLATVTGVCVVWCCQPLVTKVTISLRSLILLLLYFTEYNQLFGDSKNTIQQFISHL